jgi:hypothetical protein
MYEFKGQLTSLHDIPDTVDVFFDIATVLMKGFEFEESEKTDRGRDLDYLVNGRNRVIVVTSNNKALFVCKMTSCDKVLCETLFDKVKAMKTYDIDEDEWAAVLANDKSLGIREPMRRVYKYSMQVTLPDEADAEFLETGLELLKNIQ